MRIAKVIFVGSVGALLLMAPVLAKNSEPQKSDEKSSSGSCHAYQQAADGSWTQLPCQESGNGQTQHGPAAKNGEEEPR